MMITRDEWGAQYGRGYPTSGAKTLVVVHHDGVFPSRSQPGLALEEEIAVWRMYEEFHASELTKKDPRIAYTAGAFQTGRLFEGCGWGRVGAHTAGQNSSAYGFIFPLDGSRDAPTPAALTAFRHWRTEGVRLGHLTVNHLVKGHQDFTKPACPGSLVYAAAVVGSISVSAPTIADAIRAQPTLREGKGGLYGSAADRAAVRYLQRLLSMPARHRTGYFGGLTAAAVREFQRTNGLLADAIVGPKTWRAITSQIGGGS